MLTETEFKDKYLYITATPIIQQYLDNKFAHQDCLLLFRLGDFYELFFEDAEIASKVLSITLTARNKESQEVAMCGIPHHTLDAYLAKLVDSGYKIAICEQLETPEEAKKRGSKAVVRREVTRVITASTIIDENLTDASKPNYLVAVLAPNTKEKSSKAAICYLDIATDDFASYEFDFGNLHDELERLQPKEVIVSQNDMAEKYFYECIKPYQKYCIVQAHSYFASNKAANIITRFFGLHDLKILENASQQQISVIGAALEYINITQKHNLPKISLPKITNNYQYLLIDSATRRNLELFRTSGGEYKNSLLEFLNKTITKMASRLLFRYLSSPLIDKAQIDQRLDMVYYLHSEREISAKLDIQLELCYDIERVIAKIAAKRVFPDDIIALKSTLKAAFDIKNIFITRKDNLPLLLEQNLQKLPNNLELYEKIAEVVLAEPSKNLTAGGVISPDYHPRIEELNNLLNNSELAIAALKDKYQKLTNIDNLKISHNNILGLFIEVTSKNVYKITDSIFVHRQTMNNAVRFTTQELQSLDQEIVNAKNNLVNLEIEIFTKLCDKILEQADFIKKIAEAIAELDLFNNFAKIAEKHNLSRPNILLNKTYKVSLARHLIVEKNLQEQRENFTANNCTLEENANIWLITGPNMGGKSTFLRQNAIMIILAQMGCFVPAKSAEIGIVDKLFSRIGANDDINMGRSTFMVEMNETAIILAQATEKSFIILDEVGRGTSTYDGVSLAWATLEYIHDKIKARCLFATHYHELNQMHEKSRSIRNYNLAIEESGRNIVFLHKIIEGAADKSYGLHVAAIAGIPKLVVERAKEILRSLHTPNNYTEIPRNQKDQQEELQILLAKISSCNPDDLSPKEALEELYSIKKLFTNLPQNI
ncbi:MAG: DNA mismatch repair protein MutS [Rickettsiaceae bacterium]|nr:DNA mismatch repair protein MutS [Rickettsiaceae bacterium]